MSENEYNLTAEEQIRLVNGASFFGTAEIPEKDIPRLQLLDGGTGINFEQFFSDFLSRSGLGGIGGSDLRSVLKHFYHPENLPDESSKKLYGFIVQKLHECNPKLKPPGCYPPGILLGATWEPRVIYDMGVALGMEARSYGINILLGTPNVNLHRDIRNGRLFEGYSEDPCLVSALAPSLVEGLQAEGVAANVKHFAANNQETNRMNINEQIPERALFELYFPAFRACVEAGAETVMSAYNQINGIPCSENRTMLHDMLREEWGFKGAVVSDWNAVYHPAAAVNAGNDLAMPGPIAPDTLTAALENGELSSEALSVSASRIAKLARKYAKPAEGEISLEETDRAAYNAAAEGIVLLKNENALPLSPPARIALYGEHAEYLLTCGEGSAGVNTNRNASFYKALSERFSDISQGKAEDNADTLIYVYSLAGREGNDRKDISVPAQIRAEWESLLDEADSRKLKKILVLNISAPVALDGWEQRFDGIFCVFLPGMQGANALADCLCGKVNPSGRLPLTFPKRIEDMPTYLNFPGDGMQVHYGEGIFVGYRWYDARKIEPLYPFGYGLSYTDFAIEGMTAEKDTFTDSVTVNVKIANKGDIAGKTVVQIYVSDTESTLTKPVMELKAFKKILLSAGEKKTVSFTLSRRDFESYDPNLHKWTMEEGFYEIHAGLSSRDLHASCTVYADVESPYSYGADTSVKTVMENDGLKRVLSEYFIEKNLPWTAILSSYEYSSQDTVGLILNQCNCSENDRDTLYNRMRTVKKQ